MIEQVQNIEESKSPEDYVEGGTRKSKRIADMKKRGF
jgi:hypothetical protein